MKAIVFEDSLFRAGLSMVLGKLSDSFHMNLFSPLRFKKNYPEPILPNQNWVKIKTRMSGICGSDVSLVRMADSMYLYHLVTLPFVPGHENVGDIVEIGDNVTTFNEGDRVVVAGPLPCEIRDLPKCKNCEQNKPTACLNFDKGDIGNCMFMGYCNKTSGGWSEYFVAHQKQLFKVSNKTSDEDAILVEPLASAIHGVMQAPPETGKEHVAIVGGGIIGLFVASFVKAVWPGVKITAIVKHDFQAKEMEKIGVDSIIRPRGDYLKEIAEEVGARYYKPPMERPMLYGEGYDIVYECVGNSHSVDDALRIARPLGKVVIIGVAGMLKNVDWTALVSKELSVLGCWGYGLEYFKGEYKHTFDIALDLIENKKINTEGYVTHKFRIEDYKKALKVAFHKKKHGAIKVAFDWR